MSITGRHSQGKVEQFIADGWVSPGTPFLLNTGEIEVEWTGLSWSPNSKRIAFNDNESIDIKIMSLSDGSIEDIKTGRNNVDIYQFDWTPDGERFVFAVWKGDNKEFWLIENFLPKTEAQK